MLRAPRVIRLAAALLAKEQSDASRRPATNVDLVFARERSLLDELRRSEFEAGRQQQQSESAAAKPGVCSRSLSSPTAAACRLCGSDQRSEMRLAAEQASRRCLVTQQRLFQTAQLSQ